MTVALRGDLCDFGIADVFQLVGQQCKTGCLQLQHADDTAFVVFDGGDVVGAFPGESSGEISLARRLVGAGVLSRETAISLLRESRASARPFVDLVLGSGKASADVITETRDRLTRDTLFEVLQWEHGRFDFVPEDVGSPGYCGDPMPAERVLMDGMRRIDEWNALVDEIPGEDAVFERRPTSNTGSENEFDSRLPDPEPVWAWIDGRRTVRDVVERSGLDFFDAMCAFVALRRAGRVRAVSPLRFRTPVAVRSSVWSTRLTVAGPVALLAGVVVWMFVGSALSQRPPTPGAFEKARAVFEASDRRNRLQMRRFDFLDRAVEAERVSERPRNRLLARDALATGGSRLYNPGEPEEQDFLLEAGR